MRTFIHIVMATGLVASSARAEPSVIAMPLRVEAGAPAEAAEAMTATMVSALRKRRVRVVTGEDVGDAELRQRMEECGEARCVSAVAREMDVEFGVGGVLRRLRDGGLALELTRVEAASERIVGRAEREVSEDEVVDLRHAVPKMVGELFGKAAGAVREEAKALMDSAGSDGDNCLWFENKLVVTGNKYGVGTFTPLVPLRGPYKKKLSWVEFFRLVGDNARADELETKASVVNAVGLGGIISVVASGLSMVAAFVGFMGGGALMLASGLNAANGSLLLLPGAVVLAASVAAGVVGMVVWNAGWLAAIVPYAWGTMLMAQGAPAPEEEIREAADRYNASQGCPLAAQARPAGR